MEPTTQPNLLTQQQFTSYSQAWATAVSQGTGLPELFQNGGQLMGATLPVAQLAQLVSAPGVRYIRVGFVVRPTALESQSRFAPALYATTADGTRLSAYYLTSTLWALHPAAPAGASACACTGRQVPAALAGLWQQQWGSATTLDNKFFAVPSGTLQGYDFEVSDFVGALLALSEITDQQVLLGFGLRTFYGTDNNLAYTFGLTASMADKDGGPMSPYFDMSSPNPPGL